MPTITHTKASVDTKVSAYDLLSAFLVATITIIGFLTAVMFLIWLTTAYEAPRAKAVPIETSPNTGDSKPEGEADDEVEPGVEEFPEVETPQLAMALEKISDAVSSVRANVDTRTGTAAKMGKGGGFGSRKGGPGGGGDGIPEEKRWIINYEADSIETYATQLSFFNIDIGVIHVSKQDIWRVHDVGKSPSVIKTDRVAEANTVRFTHTKRRMQMWDQTLAKQQGVDLDDTITSQLYPESTRAIIRRVEFDALEKIGKKVSDVRNTKFKIVADGSGFKFEVVDFVFL